MHRTGTQSHCRALILLIFASAGVPQCGASPEAPPSATRQPVAAETGPAGETCPMGYQPEDTIELRRISSEWIAWREEGNASKASKYLRILGFNDFHGQLSTEKRVESRPVGGAAVLTAYFRQVMKGMEDRTFIVHAGDLIGASPPSSALLGDAPTIAFMNTLAKPGCPTPFEKRCEEPVPCNLITCIGNHELDEGVDALMGVLQGSAAGEIAVPDWARTPARFPMLGANVLDAKTGQSILPPYVIAEMGGARIGFIGVMLDTADKFLIPSGIAGIRFEDEVSSIQKATDALKGKGIRALVLIIHNGGGQDWALAPRELAGPVAEIVALLDGEIDVVISGHSHTPINILVPNRAGRPTLVTQAHSAGTAFAEIDLELDAEDGDIIAKSARLVTTWADEGQGLSPDAEIAAFIGRAEEAVRTKTGEVVSEAAADFPKNSNCDGEAAIGNLIADAQRAALATDIALIQPSWIRAGLSAGPVTWGQLFAVQPFGNRVVRLEMTGAQLLGLLNQQWLDPPRARVFNVSGMTFTWDPSRDPADRVVEVRVAGVPLNPETRYTVSVNEFLAQGGELYSGFAVARRLTGEARDIDVLVDHVRRLPRPISPEIEGRVRRVHSRR